ncbi:Ran GTPase-activating protein (RanGAP) involved in mRNA processing and transport [Legionella beliardensis]|uniref:Ran GTPase-activating protein (RanGAP) involved in mRNA processing and transport n=1 Tax=Legionella beliardensis TaxID=91822 RepID=A0A378I543_9GAMM|nr:hypothetical protein [Legionella beliardensis]STX29791.1 Ran GTPase-activating protein (RanGAP) involved in mRNA processing and transport [Legionella beliardensis]
MNQEELAALYSQTINENIELIKNNADIKELSIKKPEDPDSLLRGYTISELNCLALGEALAKNTTLTSLDLSSNNLSQSNAKYIFQGLINNRSLLTLNLAHNDNLDFKHQDLAKMLEENCALQNINVLTSAKWDYYNHKTENGFVCTEFFVKALEKNDSIISLEMGNNTSKQYQSILDLHLERNKKFYQALLSVEQSLTACENNLQNLLTDFDENRLALQIKRLDDISEKLFIDYANKRHAKLFALRDKFLACQFKYACMAQDWTKADELLKEISSQQEKYNLPELLFFYTETLSSLTTMDSSIMSYVRLSLLEPINEGFPDAKQLVLRLYAALLKLTPGESELSLQSMQLKSPSAFQSIYQLIQVSQDLPLSWRARFRYFEEKMHIKNLESIIEKQSAEISHLTQLVTALATAVKQNLMPQSSEKEVKQSVSHSNFFTKPI